MPKLAIIVGPTLASEFPKGLKMNRMSLQKLQSLIFDISESIPNGKYLEIMNEMMKIHKYIDTNSKSDFIMDFDAFDLQSNQIINSYYDEELDDWVFDHSLIIKLKDMGYSANYIARNLNCFFMKIIIFIAQFTTI